MASKVIILILAGLLQQTQFLLVLGVKPNLALVVVLSLVYFIKDRWFFILLSIIGALLTMMAPGFSMALIISIAFPIFFYLIKNLIPWQPLFSTLIFIFITTIILDYPNVFLAEIIYNISLGFVLYFIFKFANSKSR